MRVIINIICPILSCIIICFMCFSEEDFLPKIPSIMGLFLSNDKNNTSYKDYIINIPKDLSSIWKLSQLEYSLTQIEKEYKDDINLKNNFTEKIMNQVKNIIPTGKMSPDILHKFPELIQEMEKNNIWSRIKGFFSFVNLIWILAIIGILISIGPTLHHYIFPLVQKLVDFFNTTFV